MIHVENVLKTSWTSLGDIFARSLEDVLKTSKKYLSNVLKMSWRRLEDVFKTFLQDVLKTSWRDFKDVLKTSWKRMTRTSILVLIQDVFWRRVSKANIFVLMKTPWRCLLKTKTKDVFKTSSSRRMFAGLFKTILLKAVLFANQLNTVVCSPLTVWKIPSGCSRLFFLPW